MHSEEASVKMNIRPKRLKYFLVQAKKSRAYTWKPKQVESYQNGDRVKD